MLVGILVCALASLPAVRARAEPPATLEPQPQSTALSPQALEEYQRQFLSVEDELTVSDGHSSRGVAFTQGKYRRPLSREEFLRTIGRVEEADRYRTRLAWSGALTAGSLVSVLVGAVFIIKAGESQGGDCGRVDDVRFSACVRQMAASPPHSGPLIASGAVAALLFGGAMLVHPRAPDAAEMRRLADEYNQTLRRRLTGAAPRASDRRAPRISVSAELRPGGMGVMLGGRF